MAGNEHLVDCGGPRAGRKPRNDAHGIATMMRVGHPTPRVYQSGEINRSGHVSKSGDKLLRYLLVEAGASMMLVSKKWCSLKAWAVKVAKRSGTAKATRRLEMSTVARNARLPDIYMY